MNKAKAIELSMAETLRQYAEVGEDVIYRVWQSMDFDSRWNEDEDRKFPALDIRSAPAQTDDDQQTMFCDTTIICATMIDDDKNNEFISAMYEAVDALLDKLFKQFLTGVDGEELIYLNARIDEHASEKINTPVSLTWGESMSPYEDQGLHMIGTGLRIHYGRSDY